MAKEVFAARGVAASYGRQKTHDKKHKKSGSWMAIWRGLSTEIASPEALRDLIFSARRLESTLEEL